MPTAYLARPAIVRVALAVLPVALAEQPPAAGGPHGLYFPGGADSSARKIERGTRWFTALDGLQPGTDYHILLRVADEWGNNSVEHGTFSTIGEPRHRAATGPQPRDTEPETRPGPLPPTDHHLSRPVRVSFSTLHVIDDADRGWPRGELSFDFWVDGEKREALTQREQKIKSGATIALRRHGAGRPGMSLVVADAGDTLMLRVLALERDWSWGGCPVEAGFGPVGGGREGCLEWNNAAAGLDLDTLTDSAALPSCYGFDIGTHDACVLLRSGEGFDPAFELPVGIDFLDE